MPQGSLAHPQNLVITTEMSHKIVIKGDYLQSWEISSKTTIVEFGLAKVDSRPNVKYKEDFLNIFYFTLPFFQRMDKQLA